jgi:hypothetical protein
LLEYLQVTIAGYLPIFLVNMDLDLNTNLDLNIDLNPDEHGLFKQAALRSPDKIIADVSDKYFRISWKSNSAGIVEFDPCLVEKKELAKRYPHAVETWKAKQRDEKEEASRIQGKFIDFGRRFFNEPNKSFAETDKSVAEKAQQVQHGVACDQRLRPGTHQHWGEVRKCETHPPDQPAVSICKGCQMSHPTLESCFFDRPLIVKYGARVGVCKDCEKAALADAAGWICICDKLWTCFSCREAELRILSKARKRSLKYTCGKCLKMCMCGHEVYFCMHCEGWRMDMVNKYKFEENPKND